MPTTPQELLEQLASTPAHIYPEAIVREMVERRDEMAPVLLGVVETAAVHPEQFLPYEHWRVFLLSAFLLAQFREPRAYRPLCATLHFGDDRLKELWGDDIVDTAGAVLAGVYDGDDAPLRSLIEDPAVDEGVRGGVATIAYETLCLAGRVEREGMEGYIEYLLSEGLEREPGCVWDCWTLLCAELGFSRLVPLLEKAHEEGLCSPLFCSLEELLELAGSGQPCRSAEDRRMINDAIDETAHWLFVPPEEPLREEVDIDLSSAALPGSIAAPNSSEPELRYAAPRSGPKVGRNDPCPCGSGRKFKKCCGA